MPVYLSVAPCGWGKSKSIVQQIACLTVQGMSVLLAVPTHAIADEAAQRLAAIGVEYVRKRGVMASCTNVRQHIAMATGGFDRSICEACTEWRKCGYTKVLHLRPQKGVVAITTHAGAVWGDVKGFDYVIYDEQPALVLSTINGEAPRSARIIIDEHFVPIYPKGTQATYIYTATPNTYEISLLFGEFVSDTLAQTFPHGLNQTVEYVPLNLPMRGDWYAGACTTKSRTAEGMPYYGSIGVNTYRGGVFTWVGSYRYPPKAAQVLCNFLTGITGVKHIPFRVPYTIDFMHEGQEVSLPSGGWGVAREDVDELTIIVHYVEMSLRDVVQSLGRAGSRESIDEPSLRREVRVKYISDVPLNMTVHLPSVARRLLTPDLEETTDPVPVRWAAEVVLSPDAFVHDLGKTVASAIARHWIGLRPTTPPRCDNPSAVIDFGKLVQANYWIARHDDLYRNAYLRVMNHYRRFENVPT